MHLLKSIRFWRISIFSLLGISGLILLWQVRSALIPFFLAFFLAYLLSPAVKLLVDRGFSRGLAIAAVYLVFALLLSSLIMFVIPELFKEMDKFGGNIPRYAVEIQEKVNLLQERYQKAGLPPGIVKTIDANLQRGEEWLTLALQELISWLISLVSALPLLILAPILTVYILYDWERFKVSLKRAVPRKLRPNAIHLGQEINSVLRRFLRGHLTVAALVGIMIGIGMKIIGMDYALLIGIISGVFDLIPYFGPVIGAVPAIILALLKSPSMALWVLVVVFIVQQLESNIIQPKIVSDSVGLHPLMVVFVLLAGGELFGFWGMLLSVPAAGVFRVVLNYIYLKLV